MLGDNWGAIRFQNLERPGADTENARIASFSRATLAELFFFKKKKWMNKKRIAAVKEVG